MQTLRLSLENRRWALAIQLVSVLASAIAGGPAMRAASTVVLTNTAQIRSLSPSEVQETPMLRVRGLVTASYLPWQLLFVQDGWGGSYIYPATIRTNIPAGSWVEVEGVVGKGTFSPIILESKITLLTGPPTAEAETPRPRPLTLRELAAGRDDAQWVETSGVVRRVTPAAPGWALQLGTPTAQVIVYVVETNRVALPGDWVNSRVRARGVSTVVSGPNQRRDVSLFCSSSSELTLEQPPPAQSFQEPLYRLDELVRLVESPIGEHRVRVKGQVTHLAADGVIYITDERAGLRIRGTVNPSLARGDLIEASGFIGITGDGLELLEAQLRRANSGPLPTAVVMAPSVKLSTNDQARLLSLKCRLLQAESGPAGSRLTVTRLGTSETFAAEVPAAPAPAGARSFESGSILQLSGIWTSHSDRGLHGTLLCRDGDDVAVLRLPSWWTPRRIGTTLGAGAATTFFAVLWAVALRKQVRKQTEQIRQQLRQEAALERRYQDLFENANEAVLVLDAQGAIVELNPAAERILQNSRQALLGRCFSDCLAPAEQKKLNDRLDASPSPESTKSFELELTNLNGLARTLEVTSCRRREESGSAQIQLMAHDITTRKQSEVQLAELNLRLLQTSRQAGMAEVATNVLHNVGNVLNSVNVSSTLVSDRLRKICSDDDLRVAVQLLREHATDLGRFLTEDPRGRHLPDYLEKLAQHLAEEQTAVLDEVKHLASNVTHIKEIVALQQNYANVSGVLEQVSPSDLVETALKMQGNSFARHAVKIVTEYSEVPGLTVDKHQVLQILVNLLQNARQACNEGGRPDKAVVIRLRRGGAQTVQFEIVDNGVGIASHNLTRIFAHGFTLRTDGHGFGLHSAAVAANAMGGTLTAQSDGLGKGATFVLELPLRRIPDNSGEVQTS
jgi:PAS domain S-box-containing protein